LPIRDLGRRRTPGPRGRKYCRFHAPIEARDRHGVAKKAWDEKRIKAFNEEIFELLSTTEAGKLTDFTGVVFPADIAFSGTLEGKKRVLKFVSFSGATFSGDASFGRVTFSDAASFRGVTFSVNADFEGATFFNLALFDGATFSGTAWFEGTTFSSGAFFDGASFRSLAMFSGRGTGGFAEFNRIFFRPTGKQPCRFESVADFSNRHFQDVANFREAVFARAPLFHGSELHQGTDFTGVQWLDRSGGAAPAYRTLKLAMAEMRARDEEGMFAALEQECRRKGTDTSGFVKVLSYVYDRASGYGQHAGRPILWLIGLALGFFHVYLFGFAPSPPRTFDFEPTTLAEVFRFTLRQIVDPFSAFQKTEGYVLAHVFNDPPLGLALLASGQSLLSLALIALFLLALRWRFRRD